MFKEYTCEKCGKVFSKKTFTNHQKKRKDLVNQLKIKCAIDL